jgi:DNA-directed RNA polymerase subunit RPC12/RpoP
MTPVERWAYEQQQRDGGADEDQWTRCPECGSGDVKFLESYANGDEHQCRECGTKWIGLA